MLKYRKANPTDLYKIQGLCYECFGLKQVTLRTEYLVVAEVIETKEIVAVTGILPLDYSQFNGYEIDWTCTKPEYRHKGIITDLLNMCINDLEEDTISVYCSCWHLEDKDKPNLYTPLSSLGFVYLPELKGHKKYIKGYSYTCKNCINKNKDRCICTEDVMILRR
jgi:N-acetylglutamate synthase-like GNAT family acetyltransferase